MIQFGEIRGIIQEQLRIMVGLEIFGRLVEKAGEIVIRAQAVATAVENGEGKGRAAEHCVDELVLARQTVRYFAQTYQASAQLALYGAWRFFHGLFTGRRKPLKVVQFPWECHKDNGLSKSLQQV